MGKAVARLLKRKDLHHFNARLRPLMRIADTASTNASDSLPMNEHEYFKLVDMTGRIITRGKPGYIDPALAPILNRLGLSTDEWASSTAETVTCDRTRSPEERKARKQAWQPEALRCAVLSFQHNLNGAESRSVVGSAGASGLSQSVPVPGSLRIC